MCKRFYDINKIELHNTRAMYILEITVTQNLKELKRKRRHWVFDLL